MNPSLWHTISRATLLLFVSVICSSSIWAQQATANRNVILRRDPSTSSPALEHLQKGARLALVDVGQDSGFYHVRTEDDQVGWVLARYVSISSTPPPSNNPPSSGCDPSISGHVYHPSRLIVKQECISVTGIIVDATANQTKKEPDGVRHEKDGDTHGWLKVDPQFENLLNDGNKTYEGGSLVFEIICKYRVVTPADAKVACQGYADHVALPQVGSHVQILGRYVQDTFHGQWMEIHPVTSITVVP
jgi:Bacterial SH3 domain